MLLVGRVGSAPGRNGERWRTHAHAIPSTCSHFHSRRRVQVLSRLPPHPNIVRFFAEYHERIPEPIFGHLPLLIQVGRCRMMLRVLCCVGVLFCGACVGKWVMCTLFCTS